MLDVDWKIEILDTDTATVKLFRLLFLSFGGYSLKNWCFQNCLLGVHNGTLCTNVRVSCELCIPNESHQFKDSIYYNCRLKYLKNNLGSPCLPRSFAVFDECSLIVVYSWNTTALLKLHLTTFRLIFSHATNTSFQVWSVLFYCIRSCRNVI